MGLSARRFGVLSRHDPGKGPTRYSQPVRRGEGFIPGFQSRTAQNDIIAAVARTLGAGKKPEGQLRRRGSNLAVIEAGTGVGKSIGMSVPGLVAARSLNMPLVISSSSVVLQEQYLKKELPLLARLLPYDLNIAIAKGRGRYVCNIKLVDAVASNAQTSLALEGRDDDPSSSTDTPGAQDRSLLIELQNALANGTWSGDRDDWAKPIDADLWGKLSTTRHACAGKRCSEFATCAFYSVRRQIKQADVIVCNHDVLLSSLDMQQGALLPDPQRCLFLIDEGHRLPDKAIEHFGCAYSLKASRQWIKDWERTCRHCVLGMRGSVDTAAQGNAIASNLINQTNALLDSLSAATEFKDGIWRFSCGVIPDSLTGFVWPFFKTVQSGLALSLRLRDDILTFCDSDPALGPLLLKELGQYISQFEALVSCWRLMLMQPDADQPPIAKWIAALPDEDFQVHATPIDAADTLSKKLWQRAGAVVIASATLRACNSFTPFLQATGLNRYPDTATLALPSPFDYPGRARLIVPRMNSDPTHAKAHTAEIIALLPDLMVERGVLVLFASDQQMRAVYSGLPLDQQRRCLLQGDVPKAEMLRQHRNRTKI